MPGTLPVLHEVPHEGWVRAVAFSPDGKLLASACYDGKVRVITPGDGVVVREVPHGDWVNDCLLYTSPSPRDQRGSRMPSSA